MQLNANYNLIDRPTNLFLKLFASDIAFCDWQFFSNKFGYVYKKLTSAQMSEWIA